VEQRLMCTIDAALGELDAAPMLVDIERTLGTTRRTLTRNIRDLHVRYALTGRGAGVWRGIRDVYRLVVASILVTHREATPRAVAAAVGYGSVEALDHAFRHASLPTPAALARAVRAG
jgi:AraC-like DNA-binding protein